MSIEKAIEILTSSYRTIEDLDYLSIFLRYIEDFRRYTDALSLTSKREVCKNLKLDIRMKGEKIFEKGDPSESFYIVLSGSLDAYNTESDGSLVYVGNIPAGKQFGERGVVRDLLRSLTIIAHQDSYLLRLSASAFKSVFGVDAFHQLEMKVKFITSYFPKINRISSVQKERIAYTMTPDFYRRGYVVLSEGAYCDSLYFVNEGEMRVKSSRSKKSSRTLVKMGRGNCFGEEGTLLNRKISYEVSVASEHASVFILRKIDIYSIIPEETIEIWKENFRLKEQGRNILTSKVVKVLSPKNTSIDSVGRDSFPCASPYAKKQLTAMNSRKYLYSSNLEGRIYKPFSSNNSQILKNLRECNPSRLLQTYHTGQSFSIGTSKLTRPGPDNLTISNSVDDLRKTFTKYRNGNSTIS